MNDGGGIAKQRVASRALCFVSGIHTRIFVLKNKCKMHRRYIFYINLGELSLWDVPISDTLVSGHPIDERGCRTRVAWKTEAQHRCVRKKSRVGLSV